MSVELLLVMLGGPIGLGWLLARWVCGSAGRTRTADAPVASAPKRSQIGHPQPLLGCACPACELLRSNPSLRLTEATAGVVQSMIVLAAAGATPAAIRVFDTMGPDGVGRTVLVAFNGAVFDQVVAPALHAKFGTRTL